MDFRIAARVGKRPRKLNGEQINTKSLYKDLLYFSYPITRVGKPRHAPAASHFNPQVIGPMRTPIIFVCFINLLASPLTFAGSDADALATQRIEARFAQSDAAPYIQAEVAVVDGVATLTGSVRTTYARRIAEREAKAVPGIVHVVNRLRVEPNP